MLGKVIKSIWLQMNAFLYESEHKEQLGIFRFVLCATLLYIALFRHMNIDLLGEMSMVPRESALQIFPDFYRPHIQWFFWPDAWVSFVHLGLIALLLLATVGLTNRPLLFLTWALHQGILNRNYSILFGADVIGGLFLFYLCFTRCTDFFSVKYFIFNPKPTVLVDDKKLGEVDTSTVSEVFFRLMQVQICTIYMYTGFEKLKGSTWWDGTALWTVFANPQFIQYDFKFLSHFPIFFAAGTFLSIIFEVYFPAMMLHKKYRSYWLLAGVGFHLGIGLLLGLMTFSLIMISTYILFLDRATLIQSIQYVKSRFRKN